MKKEKCHDEAIYGNRQNNNDRWRKSAKDLEIDQLGCPTYLELRMLWLADMKMGLLKFGGDMVSGFLEQFWYKFLYVQTTEELKDIIKKDAKEHAEHIFLKSNRNINVSTLKFLSVDLIDMIAITRNGKNLYQDFCPMYNNNKGAHG